MKFFSFCEIVKEFLYIIQKYFMFLMFKWYLCLVSARFATVLATIWVKFLYGNMQPSL